MSVTRGVKEGTARRGQGWGWEWGCFGVLVDVAPLPPTSLHSSEADGAWLGRLILFVGITLLTFDCA